MTEPLTIPRWGPRLARLYSEDVRKLEAQHANRISPGAATWEQAVEALYHRMLDLGPVKGAKLIGKTIDYLGGVSWGERVHFIVADSCGSRFALLVLASFSYGPHPDQRVKEEGLSITLHIIQCSRSRPRCATGIPVAYISRHALNRLYERGYDIVEQVRAANIFSFIGALGYLAGLSGQHVNGGLNLVVSDTLVVGAMHRFTKTHSSGRQFEETFFDVRTVLAADEFGPGKQAQLAQGLIAAGVVAEWFTGGEDVADDTELAKRIPYLPRREDNYPAQLLKETT